MVGNRDGSSLGWFDGARLVSRTVGLPDGPTLGASVGSLEGIPDGAKDGALTLGVRVGLMVGLAYVGIWAQDKTHNNTHH